MAKTNPTDAASWQSFLVNCGVREDNLAARIERIQFHHPELNATDGEAILDRAAAALIEAGMSGQLQPLLEDHEAHPGSGVEPIEACIASFLASPPSAALDVPYREQVGELASRASYRYFLLGDPFALSHAWIGRNGIHMDDDDYEYIIDLFRGSDYALDTVRPQGAGADFYLALQWTGYFGDVYTFC